MSITPSIRSIRSIRNRLYLLLLRAFVITVVLIVIFSLLITGLVLVNPSRSNPLYRLPLISRLETYYIARGTWNNVDSIFVNSLDIEVSQWQAASLLDGQNHIIVENGHPIDPAQSRIFHPSPNESIIPITVNNNTVGYLVMGSNTQPPERMFAFRYLMPIFWLSILLAIFATLIGMLLTRRVVSPLAEVILAAEEIAAGNLHTRVSPQGSDDLRDLSDSFNTMANALEQNDRERREMLADIAHELRTPLSVLRGRLEGIMDGIYPTDDRWRIYAF
jgi:signal transduction histidine kinase